MAKRRITKRIVDALGPGELVWDADCKGFGVRRQRDARIYVVKYRYLGGARWFTIRRHGSLWTPQTARMRAQATLVDIAQGKDPATIRERKRTGPKIRTCASGPSLSAPGRRLVAALGEVLDDVRGAKPFPIVAAVPEAIDVWAIRRKTGLSQAAFAARFGINRRTLQDWEQGRFRPDPMVRALLTIVAREPKAVLRALGASPGHRAGAGD